MFGRAKLEREIEKQGWRIKELEMVNKRLTRENEGLRGIHKCDEMRKPAEAIYFTDGSGFRLNYGILTFEDRDAIVVYYCPYCGEKLT
jgi:hypothetical protein